MERIRSFVLYASLGTVIMKAANPNAFRPQIVQRSIEKGADLYYFGLGSNMLRSKVENRGVNGTRIDIVSMKPAYVENHRLAFNMRGFPPIEPAMGSLESIDDSSSIPLLQYSKPQCHGALIRLNSTNYEKLMRSEGIHANATRPGYEEVVVTCIPYNRSKPPIQAITLRARPHVRLNRDCSPSIRYMSILRDGAAELGLSSDYQDFLQAHPVQRVNDFTKWMCIFNFYFLSLLSRMLRGWRGLSRMQSSLLFRIYVSSSAPKLLQALCDMGTSAILFPGCVGGFLCAMATRTIKREQPPMIRRLQTMLVVNADASNASKSKE